MRTLQFYQAQPDNSEKPTSEVTSSNQVQSKVEFNLVPEPEKSEKNIDGSILCVVPVKKRDVVTTLTQGPREKMIPKGSIYGKSTLSPKPGKHHSKTQFHFNPQQNHPRNQTLDLNLSVDEEEKAGNVIASSERLHENIIGKHLQAMGDGQGLDFHANKWMAMDGASLPKDSKKASKRGRKGKSVHARTTN